MVRPNLWDRSIGTRLMAPILERLATWDIHLSGLFTFAHSPKHVGLYQQL